MFGEMSDMIGYWEQKERSLMSREGAEGGARGLMNFARYMKGEGIVTSIITQKLAEGEGGYIIVIKYRNRKG